MKIREKNREKKAKAIDRLQGIISGSSIGVFTDYRGLTMAEMTVLRRKLDDARVKYQVVKNTLARSAAERAGRKDLFPYLKGPLAIAFSDGEITLPAKVLTQYIREAKSILGIKGGFISDRALTAPEVETLATLPTREILIARVLGGIQGPIAGLVNCLASPMRGFLGVLQARINQLEES